MTNNIPTIYIGYDSREGVACKVLQESILDHTSAPVNIVLLKQGRLRDINFYRRSYYVSGDGIKLDDTDRKPFSTEFSFTRFLVPFLNMHRGTALFMDCDMLVRSDIMEVFDIPKQSERKALWCVKHDYNPKSAIKMDGQVQQQYSRKNWSSFMLWSCSHPGHKNLTIDDVKNVANEKYLTEAQTQKIFPRNPITKDFILFARLRPQITKDIPGEKIDIRAKMSTSNAKNNGMYNVVSTMTYSNTVDPVLQHQAWQKYSKQLQKLEIDGETLALEKTNWENHQGKRYYMKNSFDFIVETLGNFTNEEIIKMSCKILMRKLQLIIKNKDQFTSKESENDLSNSFDIILKNEDYTIGKVIESILYHDYFQQQLSYVGFIKKHPHDTDSVIRIAFIKETPQDQIFTLIAECCLKGFDMFKHIMSSF